MIVECYAAYVGGITIGGVLQSGFDGQVAIKKFTGVLDLEAISLPSNRFMLRHRSLESLQEVLQKLKEGEET